MRGNLARGFQSYFFFSSRRRHTRLQGDWSSDVCSSDLPSPAARAARGSEEVRVEQVRLIQTPQGVARLGERVEHRGRESERIEAEGVSRVRLDRKSTRLNSSHLVISYAVFCLKKKKR